MTKEQGYMVTFIGFVAAFVALVVLIFVVGGPWGHRAEGVLVASIIFSEMVQDGRSRGVDI